MALVRVGSGFPLKFSKSAYLSAEITIEYRSAITNVLERSDRLANGSLAFEATPGKSAWKNTKSFLNTEKRRSTILRCAFFGVLSCDYAC